MNRFVVASALALVLAAPALGREPPAPGTVTKATAEANAKVAQALPRLERRLGEPRLVVAALVVLSAGLGLLALSRGGFVTADVINVNAETVGLDAMLQKFNKEHTHSEDEVRRAVDLGAELIGINARDLNTFELDRDLFGSLAAAIPSGTVRIAESAVRTASDVAHYRRAGADAVLVGEALVTSDPVVTLTSFLEI